MKFQPLEPWVKGNQSVTPVNVYGKLEPSIEMSAFIALDVATDLHLANTIDSGNLYDSWNKHKDYIEKACELANIDINDPDNSFDLDNEEKYWILNELGESPFCCYNLYFITIFNDKEEKLVYIGKTDSRKGRFSNGHSVALKLHNPIFNEYNKRIYFGTITFLSDKKDYIPLEFIKPYEEAKKYLGEMEALLISWFKPTLNIRKEKVGTLYNLNVHIQNFSEVSDFLHDYFVYGH